MQNLAPVGPVYQAGTLSGNPLATAAGLAVLLCLVVAPWTPSGFALSTAVALFVFFILARQAFPNYYFLIVGALAIAIAAGSTMVRVGTALYGTREAAH